MAGDKKLAETSTNSSKKLLAPKPSDLSVINRGGSTSSGIPDKYRKSRRSSIPFADRVPQVRFVKKTEEHSTNEVGTFIPHQDATQKRSSILKKSDFPILVDWDHNDNFSDNGGDGVNQQIEASTSYVEKVIQHFSAAERDARGALDILTFPVASSTKLESLARFYCGFTVAIVCIEDLLIVTAKSKSKEFKAYVNQVHQLAKNLLADLATFEKESKELLKKARQRNKQWGRLLISRGEFRIEERRSSSIPIYLRKTMPESVTLYENEIDPDSKTFRSDGKAQFFRTEGELAVMVELREEVISRTQEELDEGELFCLIKCLMIQSSELIRCATQRLIKANKCLDNAVFDEEYATLRERIANLEFDTYFDPLCALELKSTLSEVTAQKEELVNTTRHVGMYGDKMVHFTNLFMKYCKTVGIEKKKRKCACLPCGRPVTCEKLFETMDNIHRMDFMVSIPLTDDFLKEFCHMEAKRSEISAIQSGIT